MDATSVIEEGLRLLRECKVPRFCSHTDQDLLEQMQAEWSEGLSQLLPQLLDYIQHYRKTLFEEEWGSVTWEFRRNFVLVYFEQVDQILTTAPFRLLADNADDLEFRLAAFETEIDRILTLDVNSDIRSWLFNYYGKALALQGWQSRPGETYSLVRMCHFLVETKRETDIRLGPTVVSFLENFGKQLLAYRQNPHYQTLGLILLKSVFKHTYERRSYKDDSEEVLQLTLNLVGHTPDEYDECLLWDVVYYTVKFVRHPNTFLDDEIMRFLMSLLNRELDMTQSLVYLKVLIQMLLLDLPEVNLINFEAESMTISGRKCNRDEFGSYLKKRLQDTVKRRISNSWRQRSGLLVSKLLARFLQSDHERNLVSGYLIHYYQQGLIVLCWLSMFPVGQTVRQQYSQATMMGSMLEGIRIKAKELQVTLERHQSHNMLFLKEHLVLHEDLLQVYGIVCSGIQELARIWILSKSCQAHEVATRNQIDNSLTIRREGAWESLVSLLKTLNQLVFPELRSGRNQAMVA